MSTRSPFPRKSLPQAGESLREQAYDLIFDRFFIWAFIAVTLASVAVVELIYRLIHVQMVPGFWFLGAVMSGALATYRWFQIKPELANLLLGMRGEREVGRMLEDLRRDGYAVFHDIPGEDFNIDHVLIGPAGVFAVETKTRSKPKGRSPKITYDGTNVLVDGYAPDRDPVVQAQAGANYLRDLLQRMTDRAVIVRPVVLFPGWFVTRETKNEKVWVLNPKVLPAFLRHEPSRLSRADAALLVDRLTLHLSSD